MNSLVELARNRILSLSQPLDCDQNAVAKLKNETPAEFFPHARNAPAAHAALLLLFGAWDDSHNLIDDDETSEGEYVHAIAHRIEPDSGNSAYWFRRVGKHAIFPEMRERAQQILSNVPVAEWQLKSEWDPFLFNEWCEEARRAPGSEKERAALAIQQAELNLLFDYCAGLP